MSDLFVEEVGQGPRVLLVHGSGGREATWADQRRLAGQYRLAMPDRRGYGDSSGGAPGFHHDAADIAALLGDGAHVVGFSYGGIGCLLAAARRPRAVRSLTLIEPPAFHVALPHPAVADVVGRLTGVWTAAHELSAERFDAAFDAALAGADPPASAPHLQAQERRVVEAIMRERPPWEAEIPCAALGAASFSTLVVSGGWSPAFEAVCDALADGIGAERVVRADYGGHGVQHAAGFNELLTEFWHRA